MTKNYRNKKDPFNHLIYTSGVPVALLIHILFFYLLTRDKIIDLEKFESVKVELVPEEILEDFSKRKQIVSRNINEQPNLKIPENTRFEAEKNQQVEKEMVNNKEEGQKKEENNKTLKEDLKKQNVLREDKIEKEIKKIKEEVPKTSPPKNLDLKLDSKTLSSDVFEIEKNRVESKEEQKLSESLNSLLGGGDANGKPFSYSTYKPFSRPQVDIYQKKLGAGGTSDFLPNLPDGDITMLNAKANKYALFVTRVAKQVFSHLRSTGWATISRSDILNIKIPTRVIAKLSKEGNLLGVSIENQSGSTQYDKIVIQSANKGAKDSHPPAGAEAEDGNIYFIFESLSWSEVVVDRRSGGQSERRWLLLATGLK